jgi:hypothetical protein
MGEDGLRNLATGAHVNKDHCAVLFKRAANVMETLGVLSLRCLTPLDGDLPLHSCDHEDAISS